MIHKNKAKFYLFEITLKLAGRYVINSQKTKAEKEEIKAKFFNEQLINLNHAYNFNKILTELSQPQQSISKTSKVKQLLLSDYIFPYNNNGHGSGVFFYANKNLLANDLKDFQSGEIRSINQNEDEGACVSSHFAIRMLEDSITTETRVFCALEERKGITPTSFIECLNHTFREDDKFKHVVNENNKKCNVYPHFDFHSFQSETLQDILSRGELKGIKLVNYEPNIADQDGSPFLCEKTTELSMNVPKKKILTTEDKLNGIKDAVIKKAHYQTLKVTIKVDGITKTNEFDLQKSESDTDILSQVFLHKEEIVFKSNIIRQHYDEMCPTIITTIFEEILTDEKLKISH
ncbi:hypothetical protein N8865_02520 [Francisellaceae bacterium]|nr:hypothetical protein [Francisellaceae bacterium]